jgi:hypothetical protein
MREADMRFSRILFGGAGLFALCLFLITVAGCKFLQKAPRTKTFDCTDVSINVDLNNGVDKKAVYICDGNTVTWNAPSGVNFTIKFQDCPFLDCNTFTNGVPSKKALYFTDIRVFKYTITVNGVPFDPHLVGGGGH